MIIGCIIWITKNYILNSESKRKNFLSKGRLAIMLFLFTIPFKLLAAQETFRYNVIYHGKQVGMMYLTQHVNGTDSHLKIVSNVTMRMLMAIKVNIAEESFYKNDVLSFSSVYQEVNGKVKVNRQTKLTGAQYQASSDGKLAIIAKDPIRYNVAKLYNAEPANIAEIYSDNHQQFFKLKKQSAHSYRLDLPDNMYNIYHYENGVCSMVEIHSRFYTIQKQRETQSLLANKN